MTVSFTKIQKISKKTSWFFLFRIRTKEKEYPPTWKKQINSLSLSRIGLRLPCTGEAIKRESGVNPEQSRCCKFHSMLQAIHSLPLENKSGKAFVTGISQKTYHAIMFHCFRGKSVESNEPDKSSIISFITLIQRKCVKTNKLCQVYLCVSGRRDFARTLLNSNRLK